jgi:hypothetical protein
VPKVKTSDIDVEPNVPDLETLARIERLQKTLLTKEQRDVLFATLPILIFVGTWAKFSFGAACYTVASILGLILFTEVLTLRKIRVLRQNLNAPIDNLIEAIGGWFAAVKRGWKEL